MKPAKQPETKIIVFVTSTIQPQPPKQPKINPHLLKAANLILITLIAWLTPETTISILLIKLFFLFLDWFNQQNNAKA